MAVADTGTASARLRRHYPNDDRGVEPLATDLQSGASGGGGNDADAQTRELPTALVAAGGDRCAVCDAPLAVDQRYCVECGERRGKPRFPTSPPAEATQAPALRRLSPRRPRVSAGATLVAGVATLLLALGVGVLIGHGGTSNSNQHASTPPVQVVKVTGGGGGAVAAATPSTPAATKATAKAKGKGKVNANAKAKTAAASHKASAAASKVLGTSAAKLPPPTVTVGAPGKGAGYQNGHFTGTFFGGG